MNDYEPELLICTEARITDDIGDNEINMAGYKILRSSSTTRNSGGVIVYVKSSVSVRLIHNWCKQNDNILIFAVENSSCRGVWVAVYHSPNSNHITFLETLT